MNVFCEDNNVIELRECLERMCKLAQDSVHKLDIFSKRPLMIPTQSRVNLTSEKKFFRYNKLLLQWRSCPLKLLK